MKSKELTFPKKDEWNHADLAEANSKTKQQVYNALQEALKDGTVERSSLKSSGRGKPTQLYKVVDQTKVVTKSVNVSVIPLNPTQKTVEVPVIYSDDILDEPSSVDLPKTVTVSVPEVGIVIEEPQDVRPIEDIPTDAHEIEDLCPVCKKKLYAWRDAGGIMVKCIQPKSICPTNEHPFHHNRTVKGAVEGIQRWKEYVKA